MSGNFVANPKFRAQKLRRNENSFLTSISKTNQKPSRNTNRVGFYMLPMAKIQTGMLWTPTSRANYNMEIFKIMHQKLYVFCRIQNPDITLADWVGARSWLGSGRVGYQQNCSPRKQRTCVGSNQLNPKHRTCRVQNLDIHWAARGGAGRGGAGRGGAELASLGPTRQTRRPQL